METTVQSNEELWKGGTSPFKVNFGKVMMWYFLISDTFTFACFLLAYGAQRVKNIETWPLPSQVFKAVPLPFKIFEHADLPLVFVSFMTFTLILSSVTMVRAVQEGMQNNRMGVIKWLLPTVLGGIIFLGSQYFEWSHLIHEGMTLTSNPFSLTGFHHGQDVGPHNFGQFFFLITGFHGMHVLIGVLLNLLMVYLSWSGYFERKGNYDMIENIGLYWHFVDLVWVFVFLCFYLL